MITFLTDKSSPRISYVLLVLFEHIFDHPYQIVHSLPENSESGLILDYRSNPDGRFPILPCNGWLYEPELRIPAMETKDEGWRLLFPMVKNAQNLLDFDILAACFYITSMSWAYDDAPKDRHGRIDEKHTDYFQKDFFTKPYVHQYAELLKGKLKEEYDISLNIKHKEDYEITIDIDQPWLYKHKGFLTNLGGIVKDFLAFRFKKILERKLIMFGFKEDPFEVYEFLHQLCPSDKTSFFFLIGGNAGFDNRFSLKNQAYRRLIRRLYTQGYQIGLHPSYHSSDNPALIQKEKLDLERLGIPIKASRQHYLRYKMPETFRALEAAGIEKEYSLCSVSEPGFLTGMCIPFPWYDLEQNRISKMYIHPGVVMDRTLLSYKKYSIEEALAQLFVFHKKIKTYQGSFQIILHNETFSDFGEWKDWKFIFVELIKNLKESQKSE